jgi:hypothetical protein
MVPGLVGNGGGARRRPEPYGAGLSYSTPSQGRREHCAQWGTVEWAAVITDGRSGDSR